MPISHDQFEHLDDFSGLENLHVYGDLLDLYNLHVTATIGEAGRLYDEIAIFEKRLLTLYVSYILAHKGYDVKTFVGEDFAESESDKLYTTRFKPEDWVNYFYLFQPGEEPFSFDWVEDYENDKGEKIRVIFVTLLMTEINYKTGEELDEAEYLIRHFDDDSVNYVVVHPKLSRQAKQTFLRAKEKMKEYTNQDVLLSTGEFVSRMIPNREKRHIIEENWTYLRGKLLGHLQREWPILVYAIHEQKIEDIEERLHRAKIKHEIKEFEEAITNAGVACEAILQILCSMYKLRKLEKIEFYEMLCMLREIIREQFGEEIYNDLDFIRKWRNRVVHPSPIKPSELVSLQVVRKTELFYELFKKSLFTRRRHP